MPAPYSPISVANEFLLLAQKQGITLSPLHLMKLVFFAEGWHLGFLGTSLVKDDFQAWKFGPVSPLLYRETRDYGAGMIDSLIEDPYCFAEDNHTTCDVDDHISKNIIKVVWNAYKDISAIKLSNMTHQPGTPWRKIYDEHHGNIPPYTDIPKPEIESYFKTLIRNSKN